MKQNKSTGIMQNITNFIKTQESKTGCLLYLHTHTHTHTHTPTLQPPHSPEHTHVKSGQLATQNTKLKTVNCLYKRCQFQSTRR